MQFKFKTDELFRIVRKYLEPAAAYELRSNNYEGRNFEMNLIKLLIHNIVRYIIFII